MFFGTMVTHGTQVGGSNFRIGAAPNGLFFNGTIDEFRFWNVARGVVDIQMKMNCELTGTEPNLVAYYKFNQGIAGGDNFSLTPLTDFAGGQHNGTLNNFALTGTTSNWVAPGGVQSGIACAAPSAPPPPVALAATIPVTANTLFSASVNGDDRAFPRSAHTYAVTTDAGKPSYHWAVTNGKIVGDHTNSSVQV